VEAKTRFHGKIGVCLRVLALLAPTVWLLG